MEQSNLTSKALISNLSMSVWTGKRFDKKVTDEVDEIHHTSKSGQFSKFLISQNYFKEIITARGDLYTYHIANTLPWGDGGDRLLPAKHYFRYTEEMAKLKRKFTHHVAEFLSMYELYKDEARRNLKTLYNESDYPTKDELVSKFGVYLRYYPMPQVADFRLDLGNHDEVDRLREEISKEITDRHTSALKDIMERAQECVQRIINTLDEGVDKKFKNSMIGNLEKLLEVIPALNYADDPQITEMAKKLDNIIIDPDHLRNDVELRQAYLDKVKKLNDMLF